MSLADRLAARKLTPSEPDTAVTTPAKPVGLVARVQNSSGSESATNNGEVSPKLTTKPIESVTSSSDADSSATSSSIPATLTPQIKQQQPRAELTEEALTVLSPESVLLIQNGLAKIEEALTLTPMGDVKGHMMVLQKELQTTEYLVDLLRPENIGLLVEAERRLMKEDILQGTKTKSRAKKKDSLAHVTEEQMASVGADDFAL